MFCLSGEKIKIICQLQIFHTMHNCDKWVLLHEYYPLLIVELKRKY